MIQITVTIKNDGIDAMFFCSFSEKLADQFCFFRFGAFFLKDSFFVGRSRNMGLPGIVIDQLAVDLLAAPENA